MRLSERAETRSAMSESEFQVSWALFCGSAHVLVCRYESLEGILIDLAQQQNLWSGHLSPCRRKLLDGVVESPQQFTSLRAPVV